MRPELFVPILDSGAPVPSALGRSYLEEWEVAFDAREGLVNIGTDVATLSLAGAATDAGDYFDIPSATSAVVASSYGGDLTVPASSNPMASTETRSFFVAMELSALTGSASSQRVLFAHKNGTGATVAGLEIRDGAGATVYEPFGKQADGTVDTNTGSGLTSLAGAGRVLVMFTHTWFLNGIIQLTSYNIETGAVISTQQAFEAQSDYTIGTTTIVFGAGFNGTNPTSGLDGTRDFHIYGGGYTTGKIPSDADCAKLCAYYR